MVIYSSTESQGEQSEQSKTVSSLKKMVAYLRNRIINLEKANKPSSDAPDEATQNANADDVVFDDMKASAAVSLAFNKCGANGYLSPLSVIYSKVSIPTSTYNSTWASTVPQLREYYLTRKGGDPLALLRSANTTEEFTYALQRTTTDLEQVHNLPTPVIACLLLSEMEASKDPLIKIKASDIATSCLTAPDENTLEETLRNYADNDTDIVVADLPYDTDMESLPGNDLLKEKATSLWTRIMYVISKVWTRTYLTYSTPEDLKWKWSSLRQRKDEWLSQYLARERQAWHSLASALSFRKLQLPSGYDRSVQVLSAVRSELRKGFNEQIRSERIDIDTLKYEDVVNQLLAVEASQNMKFPWDDAVQSETSTKDKRKDASKSDAHKDGKWSGGKWSGGKWSGDKSGGWKPKLVQQDNNKGNPKKMDKWCTFCNKYTTHDESKCWKNPKCTTTPQWFLDKHKPNKSDKDNSNPKSESKETPMFMSDIHSKEMDPLAVPAITSTLHHVGSGQCTSITIGVDTLSECNLIDIRLLQHCEELVGEEIPKLAGFRGNEFQPSQKVIAHMTIGGQQLKVKALVIGMASLCIDMSMVLGAESMRKMHATISMGTSSFKIGMLNTTVPIVQMKRKESPGMPFLSCGLKAKTDEDVEIIMAMSDSELVDKAKVYLQSINYEPPPMEFKVPPEHSDGLYQCDAPFNVPSGLTNGVKYKIEKEVKAGHWQLVGRSNDLWISPAFAKGKGRPIKDGPYAGSEEARILIDLRRLNTLVEVPEHYHLGNANVETFTRKINSNSCWFSCIDIDSAFESLPVTEEGSRLFCFNLMGNIYQSKVALQGFSYSAMCWTYHLRHGLQAALGSHYDEICAVFVDDILVYGSSYRQCLARRRVICAVLTALGKKISTKTPSTINPTIECVGLSWSSNGISLSESNADTLRTALSTVPKSGAQLRRLLGSINFAQSAFPTLTKRSDLSSAKKTLYALVDAKPFKISEEGHRALQLLAKSFKNEPLALHAYTDLVDGYDKCWALIFDSSDDAIGGALYRCNGKATEIDAEGLKDFRKSSLVAVFSKALDTHQRNWATYEKEVFSVLTGMTRWYRLLVATTRPTTKGDPMAIPKILILTDSMVCMYRWKDFKLPESPLSSIKSRRFVGWCETVASWQALPYVVKHCKGLSNDFADLLSRWVARPSVADTNKKKPTSTTTPCLINNIVNKPNIEEAFNLTDLQAEMVAEALYKDNSSFNGIRIKDIYSIATRKNDTDLPPATKERVRRWLDDKLFVVKGEAAQLLYTTPITRSHGGDEDDDLGQDRGKYLLVIPDDCKIDLTNVPDPYDDPDMKRSILYLTHDTLMRAHGNSESMAAKILDFCWWPKLLADCRQHRLRCPICKPSVFKMAVGRLPSTRKRFQSYAIDHKEIPTTLKERLNLPSESAILSATDIGTGEVLFQYVPDHSSRQVVIFLWTRILSVHGPIGRLCSDQGSSLTSEVLADLSKLVGYEVCTTSSRNPRANGRVERAHRSLGVILDTMIQAGDGKDVDDLKVYLAAAECRANHKKDNGEGISVHGAVYGQHPNPIRRSNLEDEDSAEEITADDVIQIGKVARLATEELANRRDVKAHYNAAYRIAQGHVGKEPDINLGDQVLHNGVEDVVSKIYYADNSDKPTVVILDSGLKVPVSELKPLPDKRPIHLPTNAIDNDKVGEDDFALIKASDDKVLVVKVISKSENNDLQCHVHDAGDKGSVFLPLWISDGVYKRSRASPPGSSPSMITTTMDKVLFKVELNRTGRMNSASRDRMHAMHVQHVAN